MEMDNVRRLSNENLMEEASAGRSIAERETKLEPRVQRWIIGTGHLEATDIDACLRQPFLEQIDVAFLASGIAVAVVDEKNAHWAE